MIARLGPTIYPVHINITTRPQSNLFCPYLFLLFAKPYYQLTEVVTREYGSKLFIMTIYTSLLLKSVNGCHVTAIGKIDSV